jgi:hypothetical protein
MGRDIGSEEAVKEAGCGALGSTIKELRKGRGMGKSTSRDCGGVRISGAEAE